MIRVLFVCTGNICRSPMAEAVFRDRVARAGLAGEIEADSAGTSAWHAGEQAHRRTLDLLKRTKIDYDGRSRPVDDSDFEQFDYILTMDRQNLRALPSSVPSGKAKVGLFLDYARRLGLTSAQEVPDPYFDDSFERVYDLVSTGSEALLNHLRDRHGL